MKHHPQTLILYRRIARLYYHHGLKYSAIAIKLNITEDAIKKLVYRFQRENVHRLSTDKNNSNV